MRTKIRVVRIGKRKLPSLATNVEEVSSSKDSNEALHQGNPCQKTIEVNTEDSTIDDAIVPNQDMSDNDDVVETQNDEDNEFYVSTMSMKSKKKVQRMSFSSELVKLERDGILKLKSHMFNKKTNEVHKEGICITCIPWSLHRCKAHGYTSLRRRCHDHCYRQHFSTEGHIEAMAVFNNMKNRKSNKNIKTRAQGMLDNFFTGKKDSNEKKKHC